MDELTVKVSGIEITVAPQLLNDFEILELLVEAESGEIASIVKLFKTMFGEQQWTRIKAELRKQNDGSLPVQETMQFVMDVFDEIGRQQSHVEDAEKN